MAIINSSLRAHTPGDWECDEDEWINNSEGQEVISYMGCGSHQAYFENPYDKALILAAPDLLAALKAVVAVADRKTDVFDAAHAAILKATTLKEE